MVVRPRDGFLAGLGAGVLAILAMLGLRLALDSPSLAELLADRVTLLVPLPLFTAVLELLGAAAKRVLFGTIVLSMVLVAGLLGAVAARSRLGIADGVKWLAGLWLASAGLLLPVLGAGPFGVQTRPGPVATSLGLLVIVAVYGGGFYALAQALRGAPPGAGASAPRRRLVRLLALGGVAAVAAGLGTWWLMERL